MVNGLLYADKKEGFQSGGRRKEELIRNLRGERRGRVEAATPSE